jgi:hypothetical protein
MDIHQDEFFVHYDKIKKTLNEIKVLINDRTKCLAKNEPIQEVFLIFTRSIIILKTNSILLIKTRLKSSSSLRITQRNPLYPRMKSTEGLNYLLSL